MACAAVQQLVPQMAFEVIPLSTPGDRDHATDLRTSPPDFFTRDIDEAILAGRLDCGLHSAKDLPASMPDTLDWVWLPWREDPRDALVLPAGACMSALPPQPRIGVSSVRREQYARRRFPHARLLSIRGSMDDRLAQLDGGAYDLVIMAGAALVRLGLAARINEWIPRRELPTPDGQGVLALTFRAGDPALQRLRSLFVRAVTFVGAGPGSAALCTVAGVDALRHCDMCLYDALVDSALLQYLPPSACRVAVGKRAGRHTVAQDAICQGLCDAVRRGLRVVRLKGGDPGIFGRLAEEIDALDARQLPYRVIPGVSSLTAATTGTGMLLTRRGVARGFCVVTPRAAGGRVAAVDAAARAAMPLALFMAMNLVADVVAQLLDDGMAPTTAAAAVLDAGGPRETVVRATLATLAAAITHVADERPGLLIVGEIARHGYARTLGALQNKRILLTCSTALLDRARRLVTALGGVPIPLPLIRMTPTDEARRTLQRLQAFDWLVLTSPSAVACCLSMLHASDMDIRTLPRLMVAGAGTAAALREHHLHADCTPTTAFGTEGLLEQARAVIYTGSRVLRLRSERAGSGVSDGLRALGAVVTDCVLYRNEAWRHAELPAYDGVFFASASGVESFCAQWSASALAGKCISAIGQPTAAALHAAGIADVRVGVEATVEGGLIALAGAYVASAILEIQV